MKLNTVKYARPLFSPYSFPCWQRSENNETSVPQFMLLQKENTNQAKPWMVDTKLQMAVCSWKMGWNSPFLFYVRLYSLNFFFLYNKVYLDQKQIFFQSAAPKFWFFLLVFPRMRWWQDRHNKMMVHSLWAGKRDRPVELAANLSDSEAWLDPSVKCTLNAQGS